MSDGRGGPGGAPGGEEAVDDLLGLVLGGEPVDVVVDRVAEAAQAASGLRVVVAARAGGARVLGRDLSLPRRAVLALDRVATAGGPGPTGDPGSPLRADATVAPWPEAATDLAAVGLDVPWIVQLVDGAVPLGVLAAFPPDGASAAPPDLSRWAAVAAVALARDADRARVRGRGCATTSPACPTRTGCWPGSGRRCTAARGGAWP